MAAVLGVGGCAGSPGADDVERDTQLERASVVHGERSVAADDGVVYLLAKPTKTSPAACSGVLVAPNIVLTAIHCVAQYSGGATFSCNSDGTLSSAQAGEGAIGETAAPDQIAVYMGVLPNYKVPDAYAVKVFGSGTNQVCRNDFAVLVLDRDLAAPLSAIRMKRGVDLGEAMRIVGYGATETNGTEGRFQREHLRVIDRGQDAGGSATGSAAPRTLVTGEGACHGDSGGPIFSEETGAVVGVYSLAGGASCTAVGVRNVYTRLAPFAELIDTAFASVGRTPIVEADSNDSAGGGDGGASGADSSGEVTSAAAASGGRGAETSEGSAGRATTRPGGSGSNQDNGCACRAAGGRSMPVLPSTLLVLVGAVTLARRRSA